VREERIGRDRGGGFRFLCAHERAGAGSSGVSFFEEGTYDRWAQHAEQGPVSRTETRSGAAAAGRCPRTAAGARDSTTGPRRHAVGARGGPRHALGWGRGAMGRGARKGWGGPGKAGYGEVELGHARGLARGEGLGWLMKLGKQCPILFSYFILFFYSYSYLCTRRSHKH
jgi:hypothetical protein